MQAVLGGIGAVSLLVAAIGITNTMVMSIYERTKEIGVMKVIGASLRDIKRLFLFESAIIGLLGGIIGVIFSEILSFLINKFGGNFLDFLGPGGEGTKISIIPLMASPCIHGLFSPNRRNIWILSSKTCHEFISTRGYKNRMIQRGERFSQDPSALHTHGIGRGSLRSG